MGVAALKRVAARITGWRVAAGITGGPAMAITGISVTNAKTAAGITGEPGPAARATGGGGVAGITGGRTVLGSRLPGVQWP
jgi:hypothetical protein